ncbi:hypothetical protein, partial [Pseudomonas aeruginosa]|uniref:hypothetical protein n=3 Tax=Pseudomonas aeruginosa TaxID=287 RepID=UPI001C8B26C6
SFEGLSALQKIALGDVVKQRRGRSAGVVDDLLLDVAPGLQPRQFVHGLLELIGQRPVPLSGEPIGTGSRGRTGLFLEFLYEVGGFIGEFDKHGGSFWYRILDQVVLELDENGTTATEKWYQYFRPGRSAGSSAGTKSGLA